MIFMECKLKSHNLYKVNCTELTKRRHVVNIPPRPCLLVGMVVVWYPNQPSDVQRFGTGHHLKCYFQNWVVQSLSSHGQEMSKIMMIGHCDREFQCFAADNMNSAWISMATSWPVPNSSVEFWYRTKLVWQNTTLKEMHGLCKWASSRQALEPHTKCNPFQSQYLSVNT